MSRPLDFQSMIMNLQRFWAEQGCLIWQPYYSQVGAGTMNPATVLRVLGPEPWNVAYVEPSVRPDDGRYGENPYRLQQHTQFQVILKPDPGNSQDIYLRSLEALGIDPRQHDIRFVEDNWESPALGAWGLGWEVWLDGQEITQFTYFQQAGGAPVDPVSVEITYGLERIAMPLQRVRHFKEIRWNDNLLYGDVLAQSEYEHSRYYFEVADVERLQQMYALFEAEANSALEAGLILPAHDYVLKCSHTFNVLDSRGAVGVTERQAMFARMRELSRRIAEAYLADRQRLEFPWLAEIPLLKDSAAGRKQREVARPVVQTMPAPFLLEIGCEELPAADLRAALEQLSGRVPALLDELRLEHGAVEVYGTPRRLVVHIRDLAPSQPDRENLVKGPPASRAYDALGKPTPAAEGFARGKGLSAADLEVCEMDGGKYVAARIHEVGRQAADVLGEALPGLIASLRFEKPMRWNASGVSFSRPIRWLLAMLDGGVVPFEFAGLQSGRTTHGLRFHLPEELELKDTAAYFTTLKEQGIILDPEERKKSIAGQVSRLVEEAGGVPDLDPALLEEVTMLVEAPTALRGEFEKERLELPAEVLVSVMKKHQRYFPVLGRDGSLLPYFIAVRNGDSEHLDVVTDGNEVVIRARFADSAFFINDDLRHKLEEYLPRLGTLAFQAKLGSMRDKAQRIEHLVADLASGLGLDAGEESAARRAAALCKADLVTHMVIEMTSLQGVMGRYYALCSGEDAVVAEAIYEHYLPRFAGDTLPRGRVGLAVGLADRLDSLAGLFAAGLAPSGTKDPFALRRSAMGLVQNLISWNLDFDLRQALEKAAALLPIAASPQSLQDCQEFITGRLRAMLIDQGNRYDVVDTVLAAQGCNPAAAARNVRALAAWVERPDWSSILPAYSRCVRITRGQKSGLPVAPAEFREHAETDLYTALQKASTSLRGDGSVDDFLANFLPLIPFINTFFDTVLVMDEEDMVRNNRLGLIQQVASLAAGVADFSKLEGF